MKSMRLERETALRGYFIAPLFLPLPWPQHQNWTSAGQESLKAPSGLKQSLSRCLVNYVLGTVKQVGQFQEQIPEFPQRTDKQQQQSSLNLIWVVK